MLSKAPRACGWQTSWAKGIQLWRALWGASYSGVNSIMGGSERGWEGSQRIGSPFERESLDNERSPVNITSHVILYE